MLRTFCSRFFSSEYASFAHHPLARETVLSNKIRVVSEQGHLETATVGVFIDAGSRYETPEKSGTAHFLEHLTFKGTPKRPFGEMEVLVEDIGAHLNAYTSREQTVYFVKLIKKDLATGMRVVDQMIECRHGCVGGCIAECID